MSKNSIIMFLTGAAIGSVATWQIMKKKYESKIQDEIDSVRVLLSQQAESNREKAELAREKPSIEDYVSEIQKNGYHDYSKKVEPEEKVVVEKHEESNDDVPCIISSDEFGDNADYRCIELSYFNDGVLADDDGEVITDVPAVIGEGNLSQIGKYEEDALHIRNDRLKAYFEILVDPRNYEDVFNHELYMED